MKDFEDIKLDLNRHYWRCWKCGTMVWTEEPKMDSICTNPMSVRTSGICGGGYIIATPDEWIVFLEKHIEKMAISRRLSKKFTETQIKEAASHLSASDLTDFMRKLKK